MTAARLERLLAWADKQERVYREGVKRLAAERTAALVALENAAKALRFAHGCNTCAEQAARDTIANLEAA